MLLVVAVGTRAAFLDDVVYHVDEEWYLLVGDRMLHGSLPYVDLWDRKPIGLFLLYAGLRWLPGDGIVAARLAATLAAALTAGIIAAGGRRLGARPTAALAAGAAYLIWLPLLAGGGGQTPVFYNLAMAAGGVLTLELPRLADERRRGAIVLSGAAACMLAGLSIQMKYTPLVEGALFGCAHLVFLRRAGAGLAGMGLAGTGWALLGLLPTLAAIGFFATRGHAAFDAFWFANFVSVALRRGFPAATIAKRLAGTWALLSPLLVCAVLTARRRSQRPETRVALAWLGAALVGYSMVGVFYNHYALPLTVPLAILAAPTLHDRRALIATIGLGLAMLVVKTTLRPQESDAIRRMARIVAANDQGRCPYIFTGDSILYLLADACLPTRYAFPPSLADDPERGATGIDEAAEVRRIMAAKPPVVVTLDDAQWNAASHAVVVAALTKDYCLAFSTPRGGGHELLYLRRNSGSRAPCPVSNIVR